MKTAEARDHGVKIFELVASGRPKQAYALLAPILAKRTPFPKLGLIGEALGQAPIEAVNPFLAIIAEQKTEGGWVVIGKALAEQLGRDPTGALARCAHYITAGDIWYAADILAERVPGAALVTDFAPTLATLAPWRSDTNRWLRRALGVVGHYWRNIPTRLLILKIAAGLCLISSDHFLRNVKWTP